MYVVLAAPRCGSGLGWAGVGTLERGMLEPCCRRWLVAGAGTGCVFTGQFCPAKLCFCPVLGNKPPPCF